MEPPQDLINKYLPYLYEIRRRILFVVSILALGSILGFIYYEKIIAWTLKLLNLQGINIVFTSPFQYFNLAISCATAVGIIFVLPVLIFQIVSFLKPALKKSEYQLALTLLPISLLLFVIGFVFGVVMMKFVIDLFFQKSVDLNIGNFLDITQLLSNILLTSSLMGLAFQFPIVITLLVRLKVTNVHKIASQRPYVYTAAMVFAALMPPTDIISLLLLTLPLVFLFEITLLLNQLSMFKRR